MRLKERALKALLVTVGCKEIETLPNTAMNSAGHGTKPASIYVYKRFVVTGKLVSQK